MLPRVKQALALTVWLQSLGVSCLFSAVESALPGTAPLTWQGDLSARMVAGIDRFLVLETERTAADRARLWNPECSSIEAYQRSLDGKRQRLRTLLGVVDPRVPVVMEIPMRVGAPPVEAAQGEYSAARVRWSVLEGVWGEGLLLRPQKPPAALVVVIPDADHTPDMLAGLAPGLPAQQQMARRLAENGCLVVVPMLINRRDTWSGNTKLNRFTNQPHREWIYRQAYEVGRHIIGYEIQKVQAALDWMEEEAARVGAGAGGAMPLVLAGHGEGGLIALCTAALDPRVRSTLVSGYFDAREGVWSGPIYRNVWQVLREHGDAELAALIAPRRLVVEHSEPVRVDGPPAAREGRSGAAPGKISTPDFLSVEAEVARANTLTKGLKDCPPLEFVHGAEGMTVSMGSDKALLMMLEGAGVRLPPLRASQPVPDLASSVELIEACQERQVGELVRFTQALWRQSERVRNRAVWDKLPKGGGAAWDELCSSNRAFFGREVIGRFDTPRLPLNPRARLVVERDQWTGCEVVVDVWTNVYAWGTLLLPRNLPAGERRPVVVCQHGLEGLPADVLEENPQSQGYRYYQAFAARLAERGFVVFAPHNPYRGGDKFRVLQRKANPLGRSLFSVITGQHEALLDWLSSLPFVDSARIGFYGLSYGGKTAMRVPALVERYALSICSADFNEWVQKNATVDSEYSYLFTGEYEMPEWNLGGTFNYAELASLIAPRPFMVERGHFDMVAPDSWVAYEFAKVRRLYALLGLPERTEIEFFAGPHSIHGVATFKFLHKHLNWPEPK
jgi:dienelactone hydrolase